MISALSFNPAGLAILAAFCIVGAFGERIQARIHHTRPDTRKDRP